MVIEVPRLMSLPKDDATAGRRSSVRQRKATTVCSIAMSARGPAYPAPPGSWLSALLRYRYV